MTWASAVRRAPTAHVPATFSRPNFPTEAVDWGRLVSIDFETFYDADFTLSKLSTSEYIRDPRFEALMMGVKVGKKKRVVIPGPKIKAYLKTIPWETHTLLCHNVQFDGFILSHHYGVVPKKYYCSLSMARGLHSNEIGAGLEEVSVFYGRGGKLKGALEPMKGKRYPELVKSKTYAAGAEYCGVDVDEMLAVFTEMLPAMPRDEIDLIDLTCRMFCDPVLKVDIPRVEAELKRELDRRELSLTTLIDTELYEREVTLKKDEKPLTGKDRVMLITKKVVGSNEQFADLLRHEGIEPPTKISPAWMKKPSSERDDSKKYAYAFAKDDLEFVNLPDDVDALAVGLDLNKTADVAKLAARQARLRLLVDTRIMVKSTTNITRAQRFLTAGANGMPLPMGYAYFRAHTGRWGGNNKMNMQNLTRGGELRMSILAAYGHHICVADSGQIEARVNGWLWGQHDLMAAFKDADAGTGVDAYCRFASLVYGRPISKADKTERFVGKVCVAEGELILTEKGLVPIEDISKLDRLWDGLEWVTHDGVIDQGIKDVITYQGLTATPDHEVFTADGRIIPLGQAASEMVGLAVTGAGGQSVWFSDDHVVADTPRKRLSVCRSALLAKQSDKACLLEQPEERQNNFFSQEWTPASSACKSARKTVRRDHCEMQQPKPQALEELWRARDSVPLQDSDGVHNLGFQKPSACQLHGFGNRPKGQRRGLQAGESTLSDQTREHPEQTQQCKDYVVGQASSVSRLSEPIQQNLHVQAVEERSDWRTTIRQVRVYDIANAGPRKRFTASGRLVLNCVLGLGFMMGAAKLQMTLAKGALGGPPIFFTLDQCQRIINTYRRQNSKIQAGWETCKGIIEDMAAGRTGTHGPICWEAGTIWLPNGMSLKYPDLKKRVGEKGWDEWTYKSGDQRKKIYGGLLCENIVQALARIIVACQMLTISRKHRVVLTTHDEVGTHVKAALGPAATAFMIKTMRTPLAWCMDLPLNAEGGHEINYSK